LNKQKDQALEEEIDNTTWWCYCCVHRL